MSILYVSEQGSRLVREGQALAVRKGEDRLHLQPLATLEGVVLLGRIEISNAAIGTLGQLGIPLAFLTVDGRLKAVLTGPASKNSLLRQRQFECAADSEFRVELARRIVTAKVQNSVRLFQKRGVAVSETLAERLRNLRRSVRTATSLDQLRGLEGSFGALYFKTFAGALKNPMGFRTREKHPPKDPVNILLSLGYTLLFNRVFSLVVARGLDPYRGFYHEISYGHPALVSDLLEEFRAPIVDGLVLALVNRAQITEADFTREGKTLRLKKEALRRFVTAFEARMNTVVHFRRKWRLPFHRVVQVQVQGFARTLARKEGYHPFIYE